MSSINSYIQHYVEKYYSNEEKIYFDEDYKKIVDEVDTRNPFNINYDDNLLCVRFFDISGEEYNGSKTSNQPHNFSKMYYYGKRYTNNSENDLLEKYKLQEAIICYNGSIILNYDKEDVCMEEIKEKLDKEYLDSIIFDRMDFYNGLISAFQIFYDEVYGVIEDKRYTKDKATKDISIIEGNKLAFITAYDENIENGKIKKSTIKLDECLKVFDKISKNYQEFEQVKKYSYIEIIGKDNRDIEKILYDSAKKVKNQYKKEESKVKKYIY